MGGGDYGDDGDDGDDDSDDDAGPSVVSLYFTADVDTEGTSSGSDDTEGLFRLDVIVADVPGGGDDEDDDEDSDLPDPGPAPGATLNFTLAADEGVRPEVREQALRALVEALAWLHDRDDVESLDLPVMSRRAR